MNKTAIKNFAIWARKKLISEVKYKAGLLGISDKGIAEPLPQSTGDLQFFDIGTGQPVQLSGETAIEQRKSLVSEIKSKNPQHSEAFEIVIEEVAYTWFNRLIAIRFMEVNDYLPGRMRVLSSENPAKAEPDFVTNPFDTDLEFSEKEIDYIDRLKDENKLDELFQFLFIKQCKELGKILPGLFGGIDFNNIGRDEDKGFKTKLDYSNLLFTFSFTDKDGVIYHLVHDIPEDDFNVEKEGQVQIIGWLYQYYNTELKDKVFARPSGQKIRKEDVPAATQLFTPHWIVQYMVENSLGRTYINSLNCEEWNVEFEKSAAERMGWRYYLPEAEQTPEVTAKLHGTPSNMQIEKVTLLDPCMGSGHILVYAFEVFMDIYRSLGYTDRDAAQKIVENNLYGLELDDRAAQLAYFAVMMKARSYDRRFLTRNIEPNICAIQESNNLIYDYLELFGDLKEMATKLCDEFKDAKEYGSILNLKITSDEITQLEEKYSEIIETHYDNMFDNDRQAGLRTLFAPLLKQAKIMVKKYEVVCTNPPYMGGSYSLKLSDYVKNYYSDNKADFFAVFMEKCANYSNKYIAMVTPESWLFLYTYLPLRYLYYSLMACVNCAHLGFKAFDSGFGTAAFVFFKFQLEKYNSKYIRLVNYPTDEKPIQLTIKANTFISTSERFNLLPNRIIAYWCSSKFAQMLSRAKPFGSYYELCPGIKTGNNTLFLREWFEIAKYRTALVPSLEKLSNNQYKWYFYNKGGGYHKWYGGYEYVVDFENNASNIRRLISKDTYRLRKEENYFVKGILWPLIGSDKFSARFLPNNVLSDIASNTIHFHNEYHYNAMAFMNSSVFNMILNMINPTVSYPIDSIYKVPYIAAEEKQCEQYVCENISYAKDDWDSFETSWDFKNHPFLKHAHYTPQRLRELEDDGFHICDTLEEYFNNWEYAAEQRFNQLKANEEELNRIFIDIYGLQDELTPEVEDKDVTVRKADLKRDVKSFVSYAVGCMFGRYSLDREGLVFAGGDINDIFVADGLFPSANLYPSANTYPKAPEFTKLKTEDGEVELLFRPDYDNCIAIF